jgi:hypothetical protein
MKSHELKNRDKIRAKKKGKTKSDKKSNLKRGKDNKILSKKMKRGRFFLKINVLSYELLASTLSYLNASSLVIH